MTVAGEAPAVVDGDLAEVFSAQYKRNWPMLRGYIARRLDTRHAHLAEDMAQEAFIQVWKLAVAGKLYRLDRLFPLLRLNARSVLGAFYETHAARERGYDFTDPANAPVLTTGHSYAVDTPVVADLVKDLEAAMRHMTACSTTWRALHKERFALRGYLADDYLASRGGLTDETKARHTVRLAEADQEEESALDAFRVACQTVGNLRAEIEAEAGVNWQSASGLPRIPDTTPTRRGVYRNDLSVTHCPAGHLLDKDNVNFGEDGSRRCRPCTTAQNAKCSTSRSAEPLRPKRSTVDQAAIDAARAMYLDPDNELSLTAIARKVGTSKATLLRRVPELASRNAEARKGAAR
jgi:hypothetical protein